MRLTVTYVTYAWTSNDSHPITILGEILRKFRILAKEILNLTGATKASKLADFITENLSPLSNNGGLVKWTPNDWTERYRCCWITFKFIIDDHLPNIFSPVFLENVKDSKLRVWGEKLNLLWKKLGRKIDEEIFKHPDGHSIIYCSNPFIIPGGRFREFYYW